MRHNNKNVGVRVTVGHLTGGYKQIRGARLDYVYNATFSNNGTTVEWDASIRLISGELRETSSGRFSLADAAGNPEAFLRELIEKHIERISADVSGPE